MKKANTKRAFLAALMLAASAAVSFAASGNEGSGAWAECSSIEPLSHSILPKAKLTLWYDSPSTDWMNQSLPIGNGQFGAMFFGGVREERIQFNDKTLWTGTSGDPIGAGSGYGSYRNFGDLYIRSTDVGGDTRVTNYRRELDIENAVGTVRYTIGDVDYRREYLASYPAGVVAVLLTASEAAKVNVCLRVTDGNAEDFPSDAHMAYTSDGVSFAGKLDLLNYYFRLGVHAYGSKAQTLVSGSELRCSNADSLLIIMRGNTNFSPSSASYTFPVAELKPAVDALVQAALRKDFCELKAEHVADYRALFDRCRFSISEKADALPTDELIAAYNASPEGSREHRFLEELYFAYGRYLMLGSARGIALPSNLQGIWNNSNHPAWNSDIHSNINVQMNYWPAEVTNLSELHMTFLDYVYNEAVGRGSLLNDTQWEKNVYRYLTTDGKNLQQRGGWFLTTENNIFGRCSRWMGQYYAVANAWYCMHFWQHYLYTLDRQFLKEKALPVMLSAVEFWKNRLVRDPNDGKWICPREFSPENGPGNVTTSHAQQLVYTLFQNTLQACEELGEESGVSSAEKASMRAYLAELDNGLHTERVARANGEILLKEWKDYSQDNTGEWPHHRHMSHLIGLYPGTLISPAIDDSIYQAALRSLSWRGMSATGWAMGWKINLWARAQDGAQAHTLLHNALASSKKKRGVDMSGAGAGVYDNLFDSHPPFQIDGNFGACAGIAEMLLQSHAGYIQLLPALPDNWPQGYIHGLKAQGNYEVDIDWKEGVLQKAVVTSLAGGACRVMYRHAQGKYAVVDLTTGKSVAEKAPDEEGNIFLSLETEKGHAYELSLRPSSGQ
ncbi:MAG: glycoside hydrolase N-terminal domain-containing protein [Bacteroidaceae bacterium]|nr:glycoside hydrolase N-terminal domain-containing protein [Bacteroidaceae bacterium]